MKKLGILTFHFAYNYGAMLQAFALKEYLSKENDVELINYHPIKTKHIYSTNPFEYGMHPRIIAKRMIDFPKKKKQAKVFEDFKHSYLGVRNEGFSSLTLLKDILSLNDINVFGSDQIWNLSITGDTSEYYGSLCNSDKCNVVYAGSFGHDKLTERENEYVDSLAIFDKVSVREGYAVDILEKKGIEAVHVCDPVFLLSIDKWSEITKKPQNMGDEKYILYYTLKNDKELINRANEISGTLGLKVISIHPNANTISIGRQLFGIGPREFLWLIQNAEYVCTNSFHASAFSLIFRKKLIHTQLEQGKGRVQSLLTTVSAKTSTDSKGIDCINMAEIDDHKWTEYTNKSKEFLERIYEKKENR